MMTLSLAANGYDRPCESLAHSAEHLPFKERVVGSNPTRLTKGRTLDLEPCLLLFLLPPVVSQLPSIRCYPRETQGYIAYATGYMRRGFGGVYMDVPARLGRRIESPHKLFWELAATFLVAGVLVAGIYLYPEDNHTPDVSRSVTVDISDLESIISEGGFPRTFTFETYRWEAERAVKRDPSSLQYTSRHVLGGPLYCPKDMEIRTSKWLLRRGILPGYENVFVVYRPVNAR